MNLYQFHFNIWQGEWKKEKEKSTRPGDIGYNGPESDKMRREKFMIVLITLDDNNGMMFNSRRQSRDKYLRMEILKLTQGEKLWMSPYSFTQFKDMEAPNICVSEEFLQYAEEGDYCFVEDGKLKPWQEKIEKLYLYRWNRVYPSDQKLDLSLEEWRLADTRDFPGKSHEKITEEVYLK